MKKFTLFAIAALFSVAAFAQKRTMTVAEAKLMAQSSMTITPQQPMRMVAAPSKTLKNRAMKTPRRAASVDELVGSYIAISSIYNYDEESEQLVAATIPENGIATTITKVDETTVTIMGLTGDAEEPITATVDLANSKLTIANGQTLLESDFGPVLMQNVTTEGDITATIYEDGFVFDQIWTDVLGGEGEYAGYLWSGGYYGTAMLPANGTMSFVRSEAEKTADVFIGVNAETYTASIYNFGGYGVVIDVDLLEDNLFSISSQLVEQGGATYGDFSLYGIVDGQLTQVVTGTGTATTLTFGDDWTFYSTTGYWYGQHSETVINLTDGSEFVYPVIPDVAAMPATPEVVDISEYNADNGYGAVILDIPTTDADGNLIKTSKLFYQLYSDINGVIAPITFTTDLYESLEADMTEIPYTLNDGYDFDTTDGYKRVWLNFDYSNYTRIGVKSIYKGGDAVNETEIQWIECQPLFAWHHASSELLNEILAANELSKTDGWTNGAEEFTAAIDAAIAAYQDEDATVESMTAALEALKQAEEGFTAANAGVASATWVAKDQEYTNAQELGEFQIDDFLIGKFEAGSYSTSAKFYTSGNAVRFYAGNTLTITGNSGVKKITQIIINVSGKGYNKPMTVDTGEYTDNATDLSGVWQGEATSVTFTNAATAQARILSIEIKYELSDEAVGISTVQTVTIPVDGIYNLQGQRLSEKPQKGLYIMGGKKYVVK